MKKKFKVFLIVLCVIILIAMLCMFTPVANQVSAMTGIAAQKIKSVAATIVGGGVGVLLISFGVTALAAAPFVGIALIAIGGALLLYSVWPLFSSSTSTAG